MYSLAKTVMSKSFLANLILQCHIALAKLSKVNLRFSLPPESQKFRASLVKNAASRIHSLIAGSCSRIGNDNGWISSVR
jgi:hypothetical protein